MGCTQADVRYSRVMLNDAQTAVSWRATPRSFVALMSLYESNFIRLGWLAGNVATLEGEYLSPVAGDCDLQLSVVERSPYTTTLNLTYLIPDQEATRRFPDMGVRVYHDARWSRPRNGLIPMSTRACGRCAIPWPVNWISVGPVTSC